MKKKAVVLILTMAMAMTALAGCGDAAQEQAADAAKETVNEPAEDTVETPAEETVSEGAAAEDTDQEPVTLVVWKNTDSAERIELMEQYHEKFMEQYPWITVKYTAIPGSDYATKLELAFANEDAPDVFWSGADDAAYIENGYVAQLDELYNAWDYKDNILEAHLDAIRNLDVENGNLYMIPDGTNINCLWYRADWFDEAGLETPTTWEGTFDAIEKLTDKANDRYGVALRGGSGAASNLEMMMFSYAGITDYFNEDGSCNINAPLMVEFVERWLGSYGVNSAESDLSNGWTELAAAFQSGRAAVIQHNTGSASGHMEAFGGDTTKFAAVAFPESPTGVSVQPNDLPSGIMISEQCENKDAAFLYVSYMASGDFTSEWANLVGALPSDKVVLETASWIQDTPWMKMGADMMLDENTQFYTRPKYLPNYNSIIENEVNPMVQSVMSGEMTAQEMCDKWAELMEKEYAEYWNE